MQMRWCCCWRLLQGSCKTESPVMLLKEICSRYESLFVTGRPDQGGLDGYRYRYDAFVACCSTKDATW
ncbi:hypothetical protein PHSY_004799 [Pseudozyma hubeiensis SY62]|uniref:Uncharacterized protein n=1 Tax=Pseudozyma hubeiensis (strain SY62) TaxID=1305764 RepID=R9P799_PSEHS|nr:hypothetical protein PHSY_004799 [Pseudozyma hubeiensis SY62]GAC97214.1 hypothetical protein PHSY_004799 [Pseudozyma hubeiensis SY62]